MFRNGIRPTNYAVRPPVLRDLVFINLLFACCSWWCAKRKSIQVQVKQLTDTKSRSQFWSPRIDLIIRSMAIEFFIPAAPSPV